MPRNISFSLTTEQFKKRSKTVTRRLGWKFLKPGDVLMGCKKCMGLKPGESIERLGLIRVLSVREEHLSFITDDDVAKEGFVEMSRDEFIRYFMKHCTKGSLFLPHVTRIEFEYL